MKLNFQKYFFRTLFVFGLFFGTADVGFAADIPKNVVVTPRGNFTENFKPQFQNQTPAFEVTFSVDGESARVSHGGEGGVGGMESWVPVSGSKRYNIIADWRVEETLRSGVDAVIACGKSSKSLTVLKSLHRLPGTSSGPDGGEQLSEVVVTAAADKVCKLSLSFITYGHYDAYYRFVRADQIP